MNSNLLSPNVRYSEKLRNSVLKAAGIWHSSRRVTAVSGSGKTLIAWFAGPLIDRGCRPEGEITALTKRALRPATQPTMQLGYQRADGGGDHYDLGQRLRCSGESTYTASQRLL